MAKKEDKLHAILAVEKGVEKAYDDAVKEAQTTFGKKRILLRGFTKKYVPHNEADEHEAGVKDSHQMSETVHGKLDFVFGHFVDYLDAVLQKEATNQEARADIELPDGTLLAENVPATFLLGLETKLKKIRAMIREAPTLEEGKDWVKDSNRGEHVWALKEPERRDRTKKELAYKIMVPATEHHPAQVEKWMEDHIIGHYETMEWSGHISPAEKSELLKRVDVLERAVKKARQRANNTRVVKTKIGKTLTSFLLDGTTPDAPEATNQD